MQRYPGSSKADPAAAADEGARARGGHDSDGGANRQQQQQQQARASNRRPSSVAHLDAMGSDGDVAHRLRDNNLHYGR